MYVDCFLIPVPASNKDAYLEMSRTTATVWKEHGALEVIECWGDDVPDGKITSFPMAVKLEPGEIVVLGWVTWPDRAARDAGNEKVMADQRLQGDMPFDGKRLIFGGFEVVSKA